MRPKLTRGQLVIILVCLTPLYALVGLDAYQRHQGPSTRGTGYVLTHDMSAGAAITPADIAPIPLTYAPSDFTYLTSPPVDGIVAWALRAGTLLSANDLLPPSAAIAEVTIQATNPPPLSVGSLIDIYVATAGDYRRVGAHVPVVDVSPLTIQVPAAQTAAWLALGDSHLTLLVSRTTNTSGGGAVVIDACTALSELSGQPCRGAVASTAATTGATAAPSGVP